MASDSAGFVEIPLKDSDEVSCIHARYLSNVLKLQQNDYFISVRLLSCFLINFLMGKKLLVSLNRKMHIYTSGLLLR